MNFYLFALGALAINAFAVYAMYVIERIVNLKSHQTARNKR